MDSAAIKPGLILAGKYQVERVLGRGGMGVVLAARHMFMGRPVALKLMTAVGLPGAEQEARFYREAQIAGMLKGEHAGKVWDCGKLEDGTPFIEMELLEGQDLAAVLKVRGPMTIEEAVSYVLEASEAVAEAHALGIVHRDLKPANLFHARIPGGTHRIKVLDFGISKLAVDDGKLTTTEQMFGTPQYMSPEQIKSSKHVDARTDVWALGVILYELLAETTPFVKETAYATMSAVVAFPPTPLAALRPDLPPELVEVVMRCLQKNPALRFQSVPELAAALGPFAPPEMKRYVEQIANAGRTRPAARAPAPSGPAVESAQAMTPPIAGGGAALATGSGLMRAAPAPDAPGRRIGAVAAVVATLVVGTIAVAALTKGRGAGGVTPAALASAAAPTPTAVVPSATPGPEPAASTLAAPGPTASASTISTAPPPSMSAAPTPAVLGSPASPRTKSAPRPMQLQVQPPPDLPGGSRR